MIAHAAEHPGAIMIVVGFPECPGDGTVPVGPFRSRANPLACRPTSRRQSRFFEDPALTVRHPAQPPQPALVALVRSFLVGVAAMIPAVGSGSEPAAGRPPLVFEDDFSAGSGRWEPTDAGAWTLGTDGGRAVWGLNKRTSDYKPTVRSPHNVALVRDLELGDTTLTFDVKSTLDTGAHRDCCVFFNWRDPEHFYYVHLGAKPDPASGQIMIVDGAPRRPLTKNTKPVPWDDRWHTVKLVRDTGSGRIAVYFDDLETPLMETVDTTFTSGRVGIGSFDDRNDFTAVRIWGHTVATNP